MKEVRALVLGTDDNSYSVARSYFEAFNKKAVTVGSGILNVYRNTKISTLTYKKGFSSHDDQFVTMLNEEAKKYPDTIFIIFAPNEIYLNILCKNLDRLDFDCKAAYPFGRIYKELFYKSKFYEYLDKIGVRYPKTEIIRKDNIESLSLEGHIFMKPDDFPALYALDFEKKQKGYDISSKEEAIKVLKEIYKAGYEGEMIVQEYVNGGDGSEYSLNGYRSTKGETSMVLARNLISDKRVLTVGNHLVQVDADNEKMREIAKYIVDKLAYVGLFNLDFKMDSNTGEIFVLEMNQRQGRTFYYSTLAGVNLIELAINDLGYGKSELVEPSKKFRLIKLSEKCLEEHMDKSLLDEFNDKERVINTANPNIMEYDNSFERKIILKRHIRKSEKEIFG
ncbi:ATP-grasp domain-containing protein [Anaerococcus sp. AGMB00486]|uniref:ATP-grasp domain-containing protein n=2 Tax=Anaerococcus TaxID=165779 RepID=A0ABX2N8S9_9FIRM|nr:MULTISPECIES: ATP-grasp domain-containing protein [Anaerococcus]MDY3005885.1 ATP-grasp domain-containing protein [Anaerococcus porci]MSS77451.1 ATP-grasp domain-containing protein [Anaerococcus porci]NVF11111.1 ATP-grasp domain-containing protein [Anaerococcus faecalis]